MRPRSVQLAREHADPYADAQFPLETDRLRVVHSAAFRRLQGKTQALVWPQDDHARTRLTHTLEVANLARMLARRVGACEELVEAAALAHDLGHPPFGHAGERALHECLARAGGFEHNQHTLRVVEVLEHPYPEFRGLNLTRAVRACLAKHRTAFDQPGPHPLQDEAPPLVESQVVDAADRLAYALHDLQDGLYAGLIKPQALETSPWLTPLAAAAARSEPEGWRRVLRPVVDRIRGDAFGAVRVVEAAAGGAAARRGAAGRGALEFAPAFAASLATLEQMLGEVLYANEALRAADAAAHLMVAAVFTRLCERIDALPVRFRDRVGEWGVERVVADYVAGMTDSFCAQTHSRLCT